MTETPNPYIVDADTLTGEMRPIRRIVVALGANLGDRLSSMQGAVNALADTPDVWVTAVSPVYETEPVDSPEGSPAYLNAVVLADTTLAANRLLDRAMAIEDAYDRERTDVVNAPRSGRSCSSPGSTSSPTPNCPTTARSPTCSAPSGSTA